MTIQQLLSLQLDCEPTVWDQGIFQPNQSSLDNLIKIVSDFDYGMLICTSDDSIKTRDQEFSVVRDNIIFE